MGFRACLVRLSECTKTMATWLFNIISYKCRDEKNCCIVGITAWHVHSLPRKVICDYVVLDGLQLLLLFAVTALCVI